MKPVQLAVARIGNSRGVRIPAVTLKRLRIVDRVIMEEREDGILLRPVGGADPKLSWEETARSMARESEDWSDWDETLADGLESLTWDTPALKRVAERSSAYTGKARKSKRPQK